MKLISIVLLSLLFVTALSTTTGLMTVVVFNTAGASIKIGQVNATDLVGQTCPIVNGLLDCKITAPSIPPSLIPTSFIGYWQYGIGVLNGFMNNINTAIQYTSYLPAPFNSELFDAIGLSILVWALVLITGRYIGDIE